MDSLTHIVIGACIGEVLLDKNAGRNAMLWGALAQSVPDIDFIAGMWMPVSTELLAHRGITHSFLFAIFIAFFLALIAARWHKAEPITMRRWYWFFLIEILCHLFLDAMNNYGIGWFEPFSDKRVAFNVLYVADPLFSILPAIAFGFLLFLKTDHKHRLRWARAGIIASSLYLVFAVYNKSKIEYAVKETLADTDQIFLRYITTPTLLNNFLWFVAIEDTSGFHVGYKSILSKDNFIPTQYFPKNEKLLQPVHDHREVMELKQFSQGYYTVEKRQDTLVFNDLRFGQINGWQNQKSGFTFHYFLSHPEDNDIVVQRGRFAGFNKESARLLWRRMMGD